MRKLPPLRALQAFEAVARHGSFKAAAAELNVTPTAISHQVQALEQACGRALLQRRPRPLRLTPAGAQLYPALHSGFEQFADAMATIGTMDTMGARGAGAYAQPLRITCPNAFASRWLVPRLPQWQAAHPECLLEIIGTDRVLDLAAGEADVAIRYARDVPRGVLVAVEIARDAFYPVGSAALLGAPPACLAPRDLLRFPLIHYAWTSGDPLAPSWPRWFAAVGVPASETWASVTGELVFREELHAIDAVVAGQGIALCSDIVVADLMDCGALRKAHAQALPGYGFHVVHAHQHGRAATIGAFEDWLRLMAGAHV